MGGESGELQGQLPTSAGLSEIWYGDTGERTEGERSRWEVWESSMS